MIRRFAGALWFVLVAGCATTPASAPTGVTPTASAAATARPTSTPAATGTPVPVAPATGRIAFLRTGETDAEGFEQRDVFIVGADGSNLVQLTNDRKIESDLYWLKDGSRLVIVWERPDDPYHQFLAAVRPDGSDRTTLGAVQTAYGQPDASPDGRYLAFGGDGDTSGATGLIILDLEKGERRAVTTDGATSPIWSPDGSRIVVNVVGRGLAVIDPSTGEYIMTLAPTADEIYGWLPSGDAVLFKGCTDTMNKIECMESPILESRTDGSGAHKYLSEIPRRVAGITSPDGAWVAEIHGDCSTSMIAAADAQPIPIDEWRDRMSNCDSPSRALTWSLDSRWLALGGSAATGPVITLLTPLGPEVLGVTEGPDDARPAWQPS